MATGSLKGMDEAPAYCLMCNGPEEDDYHMVSCNHCNLWAHFSCAGVGEDIRDVDWFCPKCKKSDSQLKVPKGNRKPGKKTGSARSDAESARSASSILDTELLQLEEEQRDKERAWEKEMILRAKRLELERAWKRKQIQREREMREQELQQERELQDLQLMQERELMDRQLAAEEEFLRKRDLLRERMNASAAHLQQLMNEGAAGGSKAGSDKANRDRIRSWVDRQEINKYEDLNSIRQDEERRSTVSYKDRPDDKLEHDSLESGSELSDPRSQSRRQDGPGQSRVTKDQLAARQVVSKHLPTFRGEPEVWPLFISSFEHTTRACGFTNLDNLKRLQDSLQGDALEAVRSRLVLPDSVPDVVEDLRKLFGRPEKLLRALLLKVRKTQAPDSDNLKTFIHFGINIKQLCDHLEAAQLTDHLNNPMLVQELVEKLPTNYKLDWVRYKRGRHGTPLRLFTDFMTEVVSDVSEVSDCMDLPQAQPVKLSRSAGAKKNEFVHMHGAAQKALAQPQTDCGGKPCWICKRTDHKLRFCDEFKRMNLTDRMRAVERLKLCVLCLNNHGTSRCNFKLRCTVGGCNGNHHTLLHRREESVRLMEVNCNAHENFRRSVIFRMVPVTLYAGNIVVKTLAFLDEGSSSTLIEQSVANQLKVRGAPEPLIVTWTGDIKRYENDSRRITLMLSAQGSSDKFALENVRTVSKLVLPKQSLRFAEIATRFPHLAGLPVADHVGEEPAILIGLDNLHLFAPQESRIGQPGEPIAVRSRLGWTVYGPEKRQKENAATFLNLHVTESVSNQELHDMMRAQYVLDEAGVATFAVPESLEDQRAKAIQLKTTKQVGDRFVTGLLWRKDERRFPDSYPMAVRRAKALERRLEQDEVLKNIVCKQIDDYQAKGYAHKATKEELSGTPSSAVWYLPLNVVVNPRKPGKVRLVWDAAACVRGVSLNTQLLKGPDMLVSLPKVICRFREKPVAFGGDIEEMYHQVRVRNEDKSAQRFLFRSTSDDELQVYVMDVLTFGATCSPSSAQYVKNVNAGRFAEQFPEAAAAIVDRHYVDDYYDSADTVAEAIARAKAVKFIHSEGGFNIRNWVSNSNTILEEMGERSENAAVHFNKNKNTEFERVLGIVWEPLQDQFLFSTSSRAEFRKILQDELCPTKRMVLSFVMSLFDPLGLLSPFTVLGRMLLQDIWRMGCDWDEKIDRESFRKWIKWAKLLPEIETFRISRSYFGNARSDEVHDIQLHVFTDASETAYGCVAFLRAVVRGEIMCTLIMSRAKVAPLKLVSIPRLELQAAVLGARLTRTVRENHSLTIGKQCIWTDAQTVLSWIRSDQRNYKQYVGFRIGEILSLTKLTDWYWVPTKLNIADQLTKLGNELDLSSNSSWVRGPAFLYQSEEKWPRKCMPPANTTEELRVHLLLHDIYLPGQIIDPLRFSKWTVLVRTVASVIRFASNCRRKVRKQPIETLRATDRQKKILERMASVLSVRVPFQQEEYKRAESHLLRMAQADSYGPELKVLMHNKDRPVTEWLFLEKSSCLYKLSPFLDETNVVRMEGRTERAEYLPFDLRFPIILPAENAVTKLLAHHYHSKFGHGYRETVKNELKQKYLIPKVDALVRRVSSSCMWCKVQRNKPQCPRMAPLPVQRLTPYLRPFSHVGVDYLGPFEVTVNRHVEKRWIALFTCLVMRAVHVEVTYGLTTQSCLMAIRRFMGRRGPPTEFFSDNGTNLRGASKEVVKTIHDVAKDCAEELTNAQTRWSFNPPATPHMGGVWERLVRSVKEALTVLNERKRLTDEILQTSIVEAEDIINSRPLTYVSQQSGETRSSARLI
ncbi:uncharacterized protein LOC129733299 [Wyeomyia smithii]|uniref:uncharacterized protein LOC129733299 n=1 Tax=Wyeomyia smithii TaxID=174621 RepID=UPI002467D084|nr:uncharacterized protein LOC129733299 [Wyeomyia smithii]